MTSIYTSFHFPIGADPEIFLTRDNGEIVGSERVVPRVGLVRRTSSGGRIVRDGVQAELHIPPRSCRQEFGQETLLLLKKLQTHARKKGYRLCFSSTVDITKKELDTLSEESRMLGCAASLNCYNRTARVTADGSSYRTRSAGGHFHLGYAPYISTYFRAVSPEKIVQILDIFAGQVGVLLDPDSRAAERRLQYGRAGEYRLPPHGLEYRTLSNFWLASQAYASLMMGLMRIPLSLYYHQFYNRGDHNVDELFEQVDLQKVQVAINTANRKLAWKNLHTLRRFIQRVFVYPRVSPLSVDNIDAFLEWTKPATPPIQLEPTVVLQKQWERASLDAGCRMGWESAFYQIQSGLEKRR